VDIFRVTVKSVEKIVSENQFIAGVILFGSVARGEEDKKSDVDLLILWENLRVSPDKRHVYIYKVVSRYFPYSIGVTVLEMKYEDFLKAKKATPLLINIIYDGIVLYDKHGKLREFMSKVKRELENKGVKRRKIGKYYYWELPKPGAKIKLEV